MEDSRMDAAPVEEGELKGLQDALLKAQKRIEHALSMDEQCAEIDMSYAELRKSVALAEAFIEGSSNIEQQLRMLVLKLKAHSFDALAELYQAKVNAMGSARIAPEFPMQTVTVGMLRDHVFKTNERAYSLESKSKTGDAEKLREILQREGQRMDKMVRDHGQMLSCAMCILSLYRTLGFKSEYPYLLAHPKNLHTLLDVVEADLSDETGRATAKEMAAADMGESTDEIYQKPDASAKTIWELLRDRLKGTKIF